MTNYGPDDLHRDWEFKIVRANRPLFRKPKHLNRLLEQEARAGWTMIEKFDDQRVRFKRLRQIGLDHPRPPGGIDPYRAHYGLSPETFKALVMVTVLGATLGLMAYILYIVK